jgi:uncharacterized protein YcbX
MPVLTDLRIYPVKSFAPVPVASAAVEPWGLEHDRRWMLVDTAGRMVSQREDPRLGQITAAATGHGTLLLTAPDGGELKVDRPQGAPEPVTMFGDPMEVVAADPAASRWISGLLGAELRLMYLDDSARRPTETPVSLADQYPLLLTNPASLAALNVLIAADHPDDPVKGAAVPMGRFRPNTVVDGLEPWEETGWVRVRIGEVEFRVTQQCGRCVMTTLDPETGERRGPEPLLALGRHRKFGRTLGFGMHLAPVGDPGDLGELHLGDRVTVLERGPLPVPDSGRG